MGIPKEKRGSFCLNTFEKFADKNSYTKFDEDELFSLWTDAKHKMSIDDLCKKYSRTRETISRLFWSKDRVDKWRTEPTKNLKSVWNGVGRWSMKYDECIECNSNLYKHDGKGLCVPCYRKFKKDNMTAEEKARANESKRKYDRSDKGKEVRKKVNENNKKKIKYVKKLIDDGAVPITDKTNFLIQKIGKQKQ